MTIEESKERSWKLEDEMLEAYGDLYEEWWSWHTDDRQMFCELYEQMMTAVAAMGEVTNPYIWVAFRRELDKSKKVLNEIELRFEKEDRENGTERRVD